MNVELAKLFNLTMAQNEELQFNANKVEEYIEFDDEHDYFFDSHEDIISLNVDETISHLSYDSLNNTESNLNRKDCSNLMIHNEKHGDDYRIDELNPKMYSLELSTLSSKSSSLPSSFFQCSKEIPSINVDSRDSLSNGSSITYYDDFYVSNKLKRRNQKKLTNGNFSKMCRIYQNDIIEQEIQNRRSQKSNKKSIKSNLTSKTERLRKLFNKTQQSLDELNRLNSNIQSQKFDDVMSKKSKTKSQKQLNSLNINFLDDHLLVKIFSYVNTIDKLTLQFVCKKWYQLISSNQNIYKLFNRIDISDPLVRPIVLSNSTKKKSKKFSSSKCSINLNEDANQKEVTSSPATSNDCYNYSTISKKHVNVDLIIKFLLTKLLNRQTYPLCLCVEYVTIKNTSRFTNRGLTMIAKLCPELKYLSLKNCSSVKTNSVINLVACCQNLKYLDLMGCFNVSNIIQMNKCIDGCLNNENKDENNDGYLSCNKIIHHSEASQYVKHSTEKKFLSLITKSFNTYFSSCQRKFNMNEIKNATKNSCLYSGINMKKKSNEEDLVLNNEETSSKQNVISMNISSYLYLQFIDLSYCNITNVCIERVAKTCVFLKSLYLRKCKQITDISLLYIAKYCQNLRELSVSQCIKLTDVGVKYLAFDKIIESNLDNKELYIKQNHIYENINLEAHLKISKLIRARYKIKYLSFANCNLITDDSMIYLSKVGFFNQIKYLNLKGCIHVSDKFLKNFTGYGNSGCLFKIKLPLYLKSLDLSKCSITDKSIEYICNLVKCLANKNEKNCLQRLSFKECESITDYGVYMIASNLRHLQHLNVEKCKKLTTKSLRQIRANCKSCTIIHSDF